MEYLKGESCRLCLKSIGDKNFKVIEEGDGNNSGILDVLKLDFDDSQKHVMCYICSEKLHAALEFKSTCLSTEAAIISYVDIEMSVPVDLREIFSKQKGVSLLDEQKICRLCMQLVKYELTSAYELEMDTFQKYIPEMNFSITKEPVICKLCLDKLLNHTSFLKNCFAIHTKIEKSFEENINPHVVAPHSELWIKSEMNEQNEKEQIKVELEETETDFERVEVKWEMDETLTKTEEIEIKDEFVDEPSLPSTPYPLELNRKPKEVIGDAEHSLNVDSEFYLSDHKILDKKKIKSSDLYKRNFCNYKSKRFCDSKIKSNLKEGVKRHMLLHKDSSEIQWFDCDVCCYKTKRKPDLNRHILIHKDFSEIQRFECDICDYISKTKVHLKQHMLSHKDSSEIQWYECDRCDNQTKHKVNLKRHMLTHKDSSEIQWFECDICDYKSKINVGLKRHMLTHKDYSDIQWFACDVCDYKSKHKVYLKDHMLTHKDSSEIEWFVCDMCYQKFKLKALLKRHLLIHKESSEIKWYDCNICSYKAKQKYNLKRHMLIHKDSSSVQSGK